MQKIQSEWKELWALVNEERGGASLSTALKEGKTSALPPLRKPLEAKTTALGGNTSSLHNYFTATKITQERQAQIDLLLFKLIICCALPFALLGNPFFIDFVFALAPNYKVQDRTSFFARHITSEVAAVGKELKEFLATKVHMTISLDGWSSRAKDEIYTFHATIPSRRSFFVDGHIFKGVSVTGEKLCEVLKGILEVFDPQKFSAIAGDGGPNVRAAKKLLIRLFPWNLNIYDPCHNLNLFMKDLWKLFKLVFSFQFGLSNYFGKSNYGTFHLTEQRKKMNIAEGMKSASDTRFSTTFIQSFAVRTCMPAINILFKDGILRFDTKATKFLQGCLGETSAHYAFMANLSTMIQLMAAPAHGILTLEGQNTTCADVFYVWVSIAWQLEKVLSNPMSIAGRYRAQVIEAYNECFEQMMTESSCHVFLLAYFLHPTFRKFGGLQLTMPANRNAETLTLTEYPSLLITLFKAAMQILKGEQQRLDRGGKEQVIQLQKEFLRYAYNQAPFDGQYWDSSTKPLHYWTKLPNDSNATQIGRIAVKIFSIMPSEICDERTASRLGWFNAARRSSILPENLVDCSRLYDYYTNGIGEGNYSHEACVVLDEVISPSGTTQLRSAPSLMDLINEENISPSTVDKDALEELLFNHPDPYDLAESDRLDFGPAVPVLPAKDSRVTKVSADMVDDTPAGRPEDWDFNDFLL
ncbi:Zinc finger bed domain-containing protein 1-like [Mycena venus]|uniref:Zinc finger bed domain-containing protein 1-like n=1 Tax=Mycena venus TaxID=2733690 RepID=A0A8H6XNI4_9AGAR|nr:Zinc finger bed domain-containing protein 1-like [Mycena venus]